MEINKIEQELPLLNLRGENNCKIFNLISLDVNDRLNLLLNSIIELENKGIIGKEYESLLNDYTSLVIRNWVINRDIQNDCTSNKVLLLYFYSVPCEDCIKQGNVIDKVKINYGENLSVFVLNSGLDSSALEILLKSFNINETPSMVINSDVYQGIINEKDLNEIICDKLDNC